MGGTCDKAPETIVRINRKAFPNTNHQDIKNEYSFVKIFAKGAFAHIRLYKDKINPEISYGIKTISKFDNQDKLYSSTKTEIELLSETDHPNIINYFQTLEDNNNFYIVQEYCHEKDLYIFIKKESKEISFENKKNIMQQILLALSYLHQNNIEHRDIKLENVLCYTKDDQYLVKLIDFGFATKTHSLRSSEHIVGSPYYMSPETIEGKHCLKSDVWSAGVIMYYLFINKLPYLGEDKHKLLEKIVTEDLDIEVWKRKYNDNLGLDLLCKMLRKDKSSRISSNEALLHPWFENSKLSTRYDECFNIFFSHDTLAKVKEYNSINILKKVVLFLYCRFVNLWDMNDYITVYSSISEKLSKKKGLLIKDIINEFIKKNIIQKNNEEEKNELYQLDIQNKSNCEKILYYSVFLSVFINSLHKEINEPMKHVLFKYFTENNEDSIITKDSFTNSIINHNYPFLNSKLIGELFASNHEISFEQFANLIK